MIAIHIVWASAGGFKSNDDVVKIPCGTGHHNHYFRDLLGAFTRALNDKHPALISYS